MPPLMGALAPSTGMDANEAGGAPASGGGDRDALTQVMGKIRDIGQSLSELGSLNPAFAPDVQQMQQMLKRLITKAAQRSPQQTASAGQVPGAGS